MPTDACTHCGGELIPIDHEGLMVCKECAVSETFLIENERPSYKDPPLEVSFYAYKRINHFREILAQFQAKETTQIPEYVLRYQEARLKLPQLDDAELRKY